MHMYVCIVTNQASVHQPHVGTVFHDVAHGFLYASHMTVELQLIGLQPARQICMYVSYV